MRVILKPLGAGLLVTIVTFLGFTAFIGQKALQKKTEAATPGPARTYPKEGLILLNDDSGQWTLVTPDDKMAVLTERRDPNSPWGKAGLALKMQPRATKSPPYVVVQRAIRESMSEGNALTVHFWARSATKNTLLVLFNKMARTEIDIAKESTPDADLYEKIPLTPEWKEYTFRFTLKREYPEQAANLQFQPDVLAGEYELGAITLTDFGPSAGAGKK